MGYASIIFLHSFIKLAVAFIMALPVRFYAHAVMIICIRTRIFNQIHSRPNNDY